jgi:drug/metabolite transporter (DMT)-like permease
MKKENRWLIYLYAVIAMACWGSSFIWFKVVYQYYGPLTVTWFRLLIAGFLLWLFALLTRRQEKVQREDWKYFFLLTMFEPFFYFLGESFGMKYVSSSLGSIIISTIPLVTPFFAFLFLKERITKFGIIGLIISFVGVTLIVLEESQRSSSLLGVFLMFFAVVSAVGYGILVGGLADRYSSITIVKWQSILGMLMFFPLFMGFEYQEFLQVPANYEAISTIVKMAFFGSVLAFILMTKVVRGIGLNNANMFTNLIPVITAISSYFVLKEVFGLQKIVGIITVISGLFISQIPHILRHERVVRFINKFY